MRTPWTSLQVNMSTERGVYDPEHPSMYYAAPCTVLLEAARAVLASNDELYDPEAYEMNVSPQHEFKYHVNMVLWNMALHETKKQRVSIVAETPRGPLHPQ